MDDNGAGTSPVEREVRPSYPESAGFGELLRCRMCGGRPYAYDMREIMHEPACTVECGDCGNDSSGDTPQAAANDWNRRA